MRRPGDARSFDTKARLQHVVNAVGQALPDERVRAIRELIDVGEFTVALENLATNLYDYDVAVPRELQMSLRGLAAHLSARGPFELLKSPLK